MKIGLMLDAYKPVINGITNFVALYRRALEAAGHETTVFTWAAPGYTDDEPRVVRSPALLPVGRTGYAASPRCSAEAAAALQSMDLVHVQHPFVSGPLALHYAHPHAIPVVYTNHTRYDLYARPYARLLSGAVRTYLRSFLPWFCERCDLVVTPAPGLAAALRAMGVRAPLIIIGNGIDLARFDGRAGALRRGDLGLASGDRVLVYTGRLGPEKNLDFLLRAFAAALREEPRLRLLLVGDGPEEGALRALARGLGVTACVRFAGAVPYERIPDYLAIADVWASASVTEVHPLSALEAVAAGLPVAGLRAAGMLDVVADGENGLLSGESEAEFAAALLRLARDEELCARLSAGARRRRAEFDIATTAARYVAEYERLLAARRRA